MNFLTRFGLARSRFTIAAMVGLLRRRDRRSIPNFPKREDPVIVIRTAVVSALFPGMAPERMENLVAIPIERKIRELAEVKDIRTLASEGSLTIYVDLKDEIGNVNAAWQRLRDKMGDVKIELPDGVVGPFVNSDFGDVAIATIAITGEGFSHAGNEGCRRGLPQEALSARRHLEGRAVRRAGRTGLAGARHPQAGGRRASR